VNYVFAYLSLLAEGSKAFGSNSEIVPAKLNGYIRTWRTERNSQEEDFKRYIDLEEFKMVDRFCWSTLRKRAGSFVNGLMVQATDLELQDLDIREVGYKRIDITEHVLPYDNFSINPGFKIWVYIAPETTGDTLAYIDAPYVNGGLIGSREIDEHVPGFLNDYIESTQLCTAIIRDIHQVFIGNDGRGLYLLNRKDKSVILIHQFKNIIYTPRSNKDIHGDWPICATFGQYDARIVDKNATVFKEALFTNDQAEICNLIAKECPWINLMLLRNGAVSIDAKLSLVSKMDNWITDLIAMDEGIVPLTNHANAIGN